jgi:hypothetical protein
MNAVEEQAIADANPWYRHITRQAYGAWNCFNLYLFDGVLQVPYIVVDKFNQSWLGCCMPAYRENCKSAILIEVVYILDCWLRDKFSAGRLILAHEMAEQYGLEILHQTCGREHGHAHAFSCLCNRLSLKIGSSVRVKSHRVWRRGHRGTSAQTWPFCLFPEIGREIRRIQFENKRNPLIRPAAINQDTLVASARKVEAYLVAHGLSDITGDYGTVLKALGIVPESTVIESVIARKP